MADTGWKSPSTTGTTFNNWLNPTNAYTSDNTYANTNETAKANNFRVSIKSSSGYSAEKTVTTWGGSETTVVLGGSSDKWGESWGDSDFANGTFFVKILSNYNAGDLNQDYGGFNISIPAGVIIEGIEASLEGYKQDDGWRIMYRLDHIQVKVYYSMPPTPTEVDVEPSELILMSGVVDISIGKTIIVNPCELILSSPTTLVIIGETVLVNGSGLIFGLPEVQIEAERKWKDDKKTSLAWTSKENKITNWKDRRANKTIWS